MDAAGKDGAIRHVMSGVNPQGCQVLSFKHPSATELEHDFLWRTSRDLPECGRIGIFNRSYYEEVLIARVHPEILRSEAIPETPRHDKKVWHDRYRSIVDLEKHLYVGLVAGSLGRAAGFLCIAAAALAAVLLLWLLMTSEFVPNRRIGFRLTARSGPKGLRMPVRPPREMLWALARMANGDGSSGHHRDDFTVARVGRIVDRYRTENSDRKKLQVSDFIQTSVSHRT